MSAHAYKHSPYFWNGRLAMALAHVLKGQHKDVSRKTLNEYLSEAPPETAACIREEMKR